MSATTMQEIKLAIDVLEKVNFELGYAEGEIDNSLPEAPTREATKAKYAESKETKALLLNLIQKTGSTADVLEWAAKWIEGSVGESATAEVREFAHNTAMSIRARIVQGW